MLEVRNLKKEYRTKGGNVTKALDDVSILFPETGLIFLLGKSGSGKSTLLNVIGGLDQADSGEIIIKGKNSKEFTASDFDSYRNTFIGFVFQEYNILNEFNIEQNIALALQLQGKKNDKDAVNNILKQVDLEKFGKRKPNTLSGGQKQRVAIARALIKNPQIIMADEPTGALDSKTGIQIFDTLKELSKEKLVIVVSHDRDFAELYGDRIIELADGKITSDTSKEYIKVKDLGNIHIVNDHTLAIKDASKLTKKDVEVILDNLKDKKGEVLLTSGEKDLTAVRQAIHLSNDNSSEVFNETKNVEHKDYDPKETKFIRSHLPMSRAFKMGSSYLKLKPVRLIFTSLLTIISITMFGIASTLLLFKDSFAYANALKDAPYKSEVLNKTYEYQSVYHEVKDGVDTVRNTYDSKAYVGFTREDIVELNNNSFGYKFAPVLTFRQPNYYGGDGDSPVSLDSPINSTATTFYKKAANPSGLILADKNYISSNDALNMVEGTYPTEENEVAISKYAATYLKDAFKVTNESNLINKELQFSFRGNLSSMTKKLRITGIISTPEISSEFEDLKQENPSISQAALRDLTEQFNDYMKNDFASMYYVSNDFGKSFIDTIYSSKDNYYVNVTTYGTGVRLETYPIPDEEEIQKDSWSYSFFTKNSIGKNTDYITLYDVNLKEIDYREPKANEVFMPYENVTYQIRNAYYNFSYTITNFLDQLSWSDYSKYSALIRELDEDDIESLKVTANNFQDYLNSSSELSQSAIESSDEFKDAMSIYKTYYGEYLQNYYLYDQLQEYFEIMEKYSSRPRPSNYNSIKTKYEAITNDPDAYDFTYFDEFDAFLSETSQKEELFIANSIDNIGYVDWNYEEYGISEDMMNELRIIRDNYYNWPAIYPDTTQIELLHDLDILMSSYYNPLYSPINPNYVIPTININIKVELPETVYYKSYNGNSGSLKVVGFISGPNHSNGYFVDQSFIDQNVYRREDSGIYGYTEQISEYKVPNDAYYSGAIAKVGYSQNEIEFMTKELPNKVHLKMSNGIARNVESNLQMIDIMRPIFLWVGVGFAIFASLMLLNYVSTSITSKQKEIGILRAVGARGSDLFKIFFSESGLMTAICLVVSIIVSAIVVWRLNIIFMSSIMKVSLLDFGFINWLIMVLGAIIIAVLGTIVPVALAARKQPVESIRSL